MQLWPNGIYLCTFLLICLCRFSLSFYLFVGRTSALQKAIFRAKNNGSSLKITLPLQSILDIEQTEAFEFQKFLKIRAVGIDDNFVMDEVCLYIVKERSSDKMLTLPYIHSTISLISRISNIHFTV